MCYLVILYAVSWWSKLSNMSPETWMQKNITFNGNFLSREVIFPI